MQCKNCETKLDQDSKFCQNCGAKVIKHRLTLNNIFEEFKEHFFNLDNKFFTTWLNLFIKPEDVIVSYVEGTRKKYVNVISYFAIAITISGFMIFIILKFFPETMDASVFIPENNPEANADVSWIYDYYSFLAFINLPIYALLSKLVFTGFKRFNYTEHLVINTYIVAQYSITSAIPLLICAMLGINFYLATNFITLILIFYFAYCYKRVFPLTDKQILLRTFLFFVILILLIILSAVIQLVVMYLNGGFDEMIDNASQTNKTLTYIASSTINWTS